MNIISGIHHVTTIGTNAERSLAFYTGALGLHLVSKTVNFDEPSVLHFYCGDPTGSPGSLISFFIHAGAARGRRGTGTVSAIALTVPVGTLASWRRRLLERGVEVAGHAMAFGREHLCFTDPDGLDLSLTEDADIEPDPGKGDAIRRIRSVEIQVAGFEHTSRFLRDTLGFAGAGQEGPVYRFLGGPAHRTIAVDLLCTPNHRPGTAGAGMAHHVAWRVADDEALARMVERLCEHGYDVTPPLDRAYFKAVYFRCQDGVKFAVATDGPGFPPAAPDAGAGLRLSLPPWLEPQRAAIERRLGSGSFGPRSLPE